MKEFLLVCLGGGAGSGARYLVGAGLTASLGGTFPFGTLAVNAIGSFLLGGLLSYGLNGGRLGAGAELALGTGVLGGFTTYSSFNYEVLRMAQNGETGRAGLYMAGTLVLCVLTGLAGIAAGRALGAS